MPAYQPVLAQPPKSNVYDEELFRLVVVFGAAVLASYFGKDLVLVRNSAGNFTLTLPQPYRRLTSLSGMFRDATGAVFFPVLVTNAVDTTGTLIFETRTEAGVATDPATGDELYLTVGVSRNVLNDEYVTTV